MRLRTQALYASKKGLTAVKSAVSAPFHSGFMNVNTKQETKSF